MNKIIQLREAVVTGDSEQAINIAKELLESDISVKDVVDNLTEAMQELGEKFERFEVFLPELVVAADAFISAMEILKPKIDQEYAATGAAKKPTVVIGTVSSDYHEIGKTVVGLLLQANGFEVVDLGADVDHVAFIDEAKKHKADIVGLSALMTTTMPAQQEFIKIAMEAGVRDKFKIMIGGAPTSREWAEEIGADGWAFDAFEAVEVAKQLAARTA
ncbi:MAG: corrinoid protein [Saccharofermentanales bacterium]